PTAMKDSRDLQKLGDLIRGYFQLGGFHIQFNVVSPETLRAAQRDPEKYRDLVVRVAGYSAFFTALSKVLQDDIINRTEQQVL
ncbi:MAG TPA: glycine radical domain-containing protein, partial [Chloroflexota bacterium]|nr:glycine radical domain-containing protein [Chloroflexota bacterium]